MRKKGLFHKLLVFLCLTAGLAGCKKTPEEVTMISGFNYFDLPKLPLEEELLETVLEDKNLRVERIISTGQTTQGWYDQEEHEYVVLLAGKAQIEYEDGKKSDLVSGDTLLLPAHVKHRVSYTSEEPACIWLCIFWS